MGQIVRQLSSANTWTGAIQMSGRFNFVLKGATAFEGTVRLQRSFINPYGQQVSTHPPVWENLINPDLTATSADPHNFTPDALTEQAFAWAPNEPEKEGVWYRAGIPTGGYTSGTVEIRISQ